jgi:hypothetical protein
MSPPIGVPRLIVTSGTQHGASFEIAPGRTVIGRGADAGIVLHDASISRRHAAVDRDGDRVTLVDLGSANGTRINRRPAAGARPLSDGDVVRVGAVELVFAGSTSSTGLAATPSPPTAGTAGLTSRHRTRAMVFAGLAGVIALLFESVQSWFRGMGGPVAWLAVGAVAAAGGIASMLLSLGRDRALRSPGAPQPPAGPPVGGTPPYQAPPVPYRPPPQPARRRVSTAAVVVVILLVCGAGGAVITPGVLWAVDRVQGLVCPVCGPSDDWLVTPARGTVDPLTVTVTRVEVNSRAIMVSLTVANGGDEAATLNAGFSTFTTAGQTFRHERGGDFTIEAVPDVEAYGTFVYKGVPPRSATEATLTFTRIFWLGPESLTVPGIPLNAP